MAVKAAAKASPLDTGRAISGFYFHRLLCRIFSNEGSPFLLKGGQSMLARTVDARATRDIDLLSERGDLDSALADLRRLAAVDLGDFVSFEFVKAEPIKTNDEYRSGLNVVFAPLIGVKRMQDVSIDLVVDEVPQGEAEVLAPADRIDVADIPTFNYRIYPAASSLADKLCAMLEEHDGRPSSRTKDLVDVVVYALMVDIDGTALCDRIRTEAGARRMSLPDRFSIPSEWHGLHASRFGRLVRQTGLPSEYSDIGRAERLATRLFDPALDRRADGRKWDREDLCWK